jgi:hypothetical protein
MEPLQRVIDCFGLDGQASFDTVSQQMSKVIWEDIVKKIQDDGFEEFRGAFLVALGHWGPET